MWRSALAGFLHRHVSVYAGGIAVARRQGVLDRQKVCRFRFQKHTVRSKVAFNLILQVPVGIVAAIALGIASSSWRWAPLWPSSSS
ncbi:MAG: hypothetical protein MZU97_03695 [Bacillus subtilis]|nr:hypothetical protein [Bacillus subtilis]